jgi:hypothetical protein
VGKTHRTTRRFTQNSAIRGARTLLWHIITCAQRRGARTFYKAMATNSGAAATARLAGELRMFISAKRNGAWHLFNRGDMAPSTAATGACGKRLRRARARIAG